MSCSELQEQVEFRDNFYKALRGKGQIENAQGESVDVELILALPFWVRAEVVASLGIKVGLFQINPQWTQLYAISDNTVFRIPTHEFQKSSARRDYFLEQLPFPVMPDLLMQSVLSQSSFVGARLEACAYLEDENAYELRYVGASYSRAVWVDPTAYYPLQLWHFERGFPPIMSPESLKRADWHLKFSKLVGRGASALPKRMEAYQAGALRWAFEWSWAERWESFNEKSFQWRPGASIIIKDY